VRWEELLKGVDANAMIAQAVAAMDVDDLAAALRRVPAKNRNSFFSDLRLPQMRNPTPVVYRQALQRLVRKPSAFQQRVALFLTLDMLSSLDVLADDLDIDAVNEGDSAKEWEERIRGVLSILSDELPPGLIRLSIAAAVAEAHRLAGPLLTVATEDNLIRLSGAPGPDPAPDPSPEQSDQGKTDVDQLGDPEPARLHDAADEDSADVSGLETALADELGDLLEGEPETSSVHVSETATLRQRIGALDTEGARQAAGRILEHVSRGARPVDADLEAVAAFVDMLDGLREELTERLGEELAEGSVAAFENAVELLTARSRPDQRSMLLARLANIVGPEGFAELIEKIHKDARAVLGGPLNKPEAEGLIALAEIIEAAASDELDDERLMVLDERARELLPTAFHPLIMLAGRGRLHLPEVTEVPATESTPGGVTTLHEPGRDLVNAGPRELDATTQLAESTLNQGDRASMPQAPIRTVVDKKELETERVSEQPPIEDTGLESMEDPAARQDDKDEARAKLAAVERTHGAQWLTEGVRNAASTLISEDRLGLAAWLAQTAGAPEATVNGLRIAAYGNAMRTATGDCAGKLSELAGELRLRELQNSPARLLVFVTAARAALLSPFSNATQLLAEMAPTVSTLPALAAISDIVHQGALRGVQLVNASDAAMASVALLEAEVTDAVELAAESLRAGPTRTIKYHRATEIWQDWISPGGLLGSLLETVAADRRSDRASISARVLELRNPKHFDKVVDDADRMHRSKSHRVPIVAGARLRLLDRAREVVDQVAAWLDAVDRLEGFRATEGGADWQQVPVAELRSQLRPYKEGALEALEDLAADDDPLALASSAAAKRSLSATFALFDGVPLPGDEPPAEFVANLELLKVTEVELDSLTPIGDVPVDGILAATGREWIEAYEQREAHGDHAGTGLIIEIIRDTDPNLAITLSRRREEARRADEVLFRGEVATGGDDLARARRQGYVDEEAWSDLTARLETVTNSKRQDFGGLRRQLGLLLNDLQRTRSAASAQALERLAALRGESDGVRAVAGRIEALIRDGHLATADEFLALAESGEELPSSDSEQDLLEQLWPGFVDSLAVRPLTAAAAETAGRGEVWNGTLDFSALAPTRRETTARAIEAWTRYSGGPRNGKYSAGLKDVFALAGIEADGEARPNEVRSSGTRLWLDLTGVRRLGGALVPTFGTLSGGGGGERLRLLLVWGQPSASELAEIATRDASPRPVLVLYFGLLPASERRTMTELARRRRSSAVAVIDDAVVAFLATRAEPRFDTLMSAVLPFTAINPYTPRVAGDVPQEMFYGRADEIHEIIDPLGTSFIYGGRQLGKSSLLRATARRFDNESSQRALYLDLKREGIGRIRRPADVWDVLWDQLTQASVISAKKPQPRSLAEHLLAAVRTWLDARPDRRLLLLLDECDDFLEADAAEKFPTVSRLKGLLEETNRRCKPVFAGLHQVQRFQNIPNQPLAHLGRPVLVGPLRPKAAFDLLDRPMRALGYRFASDELVNRVLAYCNNQPSLLQLFGEALVNHLVQMPVAPGAPPHVVTENDVESAYASRALREEFRHRFELTLKLDLRYKVIAYAMAYNTHETGPATVSDPVELRSDCERWWPKGFSGMPSDEFRALLGEMVGLGVLSEVDSGFRVRSPNVLRMLGTSDEIEERLLDAETYPLPEPFQAASFRRPMPSGIHRAPLNEAQLGQLLDRRNQCLVIAASPALGLADVATALKDSSPREDSVKYLAVRGQAISPAEGRPVTGKHRLLIADMTTLDARSASAAIASARAAVARAAGGTLAIAALTGPIHAPLWANVAVRGQTITETVRLVELRRWDLAGLRMWMRDETELPFQDEDACKALLRSTGGWPVLVDRVVDTVAGESRSAQAALDGLATQLRTREGATEFVNAAGVAVHPQVATVWGILVHLNEPAFRDDLAELLLDDAGGQGEALVDILRVLGALTTTDDGRLECEPVLAAAWRTARREQ
jgi:hypothetical protein